MSPFPFTNAVPFVVSFSWLATVKRKVSLWEVSYGDLFPSLSDPCSCDAPSKSWDSLLELEMESTPLFSSKKIWPTWYLSLKNSSSASSPLGSFVPRRSKAHHQVTKLWTRSAAHIAASMEPAQVHFGGIACGVYTTHDTVILTKSHSNATKLTLSSTHSQSHSTHSYSRSIHSHSSSQFLVAILLSLSH